MKAYSTCLSFVPLILRALRKIKLRTCGQELRKSVLPVQYVEGAAEAPPDSHVQALCHGRRWRRVTRVTAVAVV